ncbi:hypothetical protein DLAC_03022 [Tieghemostelium lacteum]|uniref:Uncharacterized protein n=1 Tax=Tieghemostelium lacteum TaxID=361077 RepID=A0A152A3Z2_TIELA|nr:hypothetical protein DLAC_03022 [Tieghemostelium lacteum]|eukprot:KYR00958.1 hypothetical protein DLAC_03022 [Tieghemostelium lacteum]
MISISFLSDYHEKYPVVLPNYIIIKILNEITLSHVTGQAFNSNRLKALCLFVTRILLVCKEWKNNIVPRIYVKKFYLYSVEHIEMVRYLHRVGIKAPVGWHQDAVDKNTKQYLVKDTKHYITDIKLVDVNNSERIDRVIDNFIDRDSLSELDIHCTNIQLLQEFFQKSSPLTSLTDLLVTLEDEDKYPGADGELEKINQLFLVQNQLNELKRLKINAKVTGVDGNPYVESISSLFQLRSLTSLSLLRVKCSVPCLRSIIRGCASLREFQAFCRFSSETKDSFIFNQVLEELVYNRNLTSVTFSTSDYYSTYEYYSISMKVLIHLLNENHTLTRLALTEVDVDYSESDTTQYERISNQTMQYLSFTKNYTILKAIYNLWSGPSAIVNSHITWNSDESTFQCIRDHLPQLCTATIRCEGISHYQYLQNIINLNLPSLKQLIITPHYNAQNNLPIQEFFSDLQHNTFIKELYFETVWSNGDFHQLLLNTSTISHINIPLDSVDLVGFSDAICKNRTVTQLYIYYTVYHNCSLAELLEYISKIIITNESLLSLSFTFPFNSKKEFLITDQLDKFKLALANRKSLQYLNISPTKNNELQKLIDSII